MRSCSPRPNVRPTAKALIRGRDTVLGTHTRARPHRLRHPDTLTAATQASRHRSDGALKDLNC